MLIFAALGGCRGEIEIPALGLFAGPPPAPVTAAPVAAEAVTEPPAGGCFERARHFSGLVEMPCGTVARETR